MDSVIKLQTEGFTANGVDIIQCVSRSSYSYNCAKYPMHLKCEYIPNNRVFKFFDNMMRGGLCIAINRLFSKTLNELRNMTENMDLLGLDVNSLYATTMATYKMPIGGSQFFSDRDVE